MSVTANIGLTKAAVAQAQKETTYNDDLDIIDAGFQGFIAGLRLEWLSASSIKVKTGLAQIPSGALRSVAADITVTGISLGNNTWGHVYLYDNAGAAAVEVVTTAPASYFGTAYQKTGNATRRYLGSVRTDGSGNILNFQHDGDLILYLGNAGATPLLVLNGGTATTETTIACTSVVPTTSRTTQVRAINTATAGDVSFGNSVDSVTPPTTGINFALAGKEKDIRIPLDSSQAFTYAYSVAPTGGSLFISVLGYRFYR